MTCFRLFFALLLCWFNQAQAQTVTPISGKISYEVTQRTDPSQAQIIINGQQVKPGSTLPDGSRLPELPDVITFGQTLTFANGLAHEQRDRRNGGGMMITRIEGGPGGGDRPGGDRPGGERLGGNGQGGGQNRSRNFRRPIENETFVDGLNRQLAQITTIHKDSLTTEVYRLNAPMPAQPDGWKDSDKTKKIAGFSCQKATCSIKDVTYTIWYTTELPFTYSPKLDLTPTKGVVLQIESDESSYKATKFEAQPIANADVSPTPTAKVVTADELDAIRKKAMADFRQRMLQQFQPRN